MAVEIGALRALLSLDSAAFDKGAKRAQASMNNLQRSLAKTGDRMQKIGRTMSTRVTAPIVAATALMARSAVNNAVEIERLAKVSNAGTTEFQKFAAGARDAGIEQDKLADILKDTNDRVGDFLSTGGGPMKDFFENIAPKVGVTADQFKKLSGPQALQLYVSSLEKAGLSQQEMTFYLEAMASDATLLLPLLKDNGKEMARLGDSAERAGVIMDGKTLEALLKTRDAMRDAGDAAKGLFTQIMASLAPTMEAIAEKVGEAARWFSELSPEMKRMIGIAAGVAATIGPLAVALGFVAAGLAAMASPIGVVVLGLGAVAGVAALVVSNWDAISAKMPELTAALETVGNVIKASFATVGDKLKGVADVVNGAIATIVGVITGDLKGALDGMKQSWQGLETIGKATMDALLGVMEAIVPGFRQAVDDIIATVSGLPAKLKQWGIDAIQGFVDGIKAKWAELAPSITSIFTLSDAPVSAQATRNAGLAAGRAAAAKRAQQSVGADLSQGQAEGILSGEGAVRSAAEQVTRAAEDASREVSETQSPSRVWMRLGRDLMDGLGVGIADGAQAAAASAAAAANRVTAAASAAQPALNTMPDTLRESTNEANTLGNRLAGMFSSAAKGAASFSDFLGNIANQLSNMFMDQAFQAIFGGGSGGGSGLFGTLMGSIGIPGFANGTNYAPGGLAMVGERGPELVNLPRGSQVIPNNRLSGSGGGQVDVRVYVDEGGNWKSAVERISGNVSARVTDAKLAANSRAQADNKYLSGGR